MEQNRLKRENPSIKVAIASSRVSKNAIQEIPAETPAKRRTTRSSTTKSSTTLQSPARKIQGRIYEKLRESQKRKKTQNVEAACNIRSLVDLKEVLDENSEDDGSQLQLSVDADKKGIMDSMTAQQFKYIRLAKMLKFEKTKTAEFEQVKKMLALLSSNNHQLYRLIREQIEALDCSRDTEIDKAKMLKLLAELDTADSPTYSDVKDTSILLKRQSQVSELGTNQSNMRVQFRAATENSQMPGLNRLKSRTMTTKLEEEPKSVLKEDSDLNISPTTTRRRTRGSFRTTTFIPATLNVIQSLSRFAVQQPVQQPAFGKKLELPKKANAMAEINARLRKMIEKNRKNAGAISIKKVLKLITSFIVDKIAAASTSASVRDQDMMYFVYSCLYNTYAVAKIAEAKFVIFMNSLRHYSGIQRVANFMKLCGLLEPNKNWTPDESKQFLQGYEFLLLQQKIGMSVQNSEVEKRHYTLFVRSMEYAKQFCEKRQLNQELLELKKEMEAHRENDSIGHNRMGVIKIDTFLELIIKTYRKYKAKLREALKPAFEACNFAKAPLLGYDEFCILVKNIEPEKYDMRKLGEIYVNYEDEVDGYLGISLEKFVVIAIEHELFSAEKLRRYVGAYDDNEIRKNFELLKGFWNEKKNRMGNVIEFNKKLHSEEVIEFWTNALEALDLGLNVKKTQEIMCSLIRYRVLVNELNLTFGVNIPIYKE